MNFNILLNSILLVLLPKKVKRFVLKLYNNYRKNVQLRNFQISLHPTIKRDMIRKVGKENLIIKITAKSLYFSIMIDRTFDINS